MPVTVRSKTRVSGFAVQSSLRSAMRLIVLLVLASSCTVLRAQTIKIKLVNGRSGIPMAHACVSVGLDHLDHMLAIPTDEDGFARLRLTENEAEINIKNHWKQCGDWGVIDPVVRYSDVIGIHAGYVLCQARTPEYSWLARLTFPTKQVLEQGIGTANLCGKSTASPHPGE